MLFMVYQQPLCPKELWHFVHQCYGNELGLTSDDEDYVPPDDDFNTMGWVCLYTISSDFHHRYLSTHHQNLLSLLGIEWQPKFETDLR